MTSLSGQFSTFSKLVICAMMIRGRHRGLPYQLDRAIMLPGRRDERDGEEGRIESKERREMAKMKRFHTQ
jgi:Trk-type K+ transport system membrane component